MRRRTMKTLLSALTITALMGSAPLSAIAAETEPVEEVNVEVTEDIDAEPAEESTESTEVISVEEIMEPAEDMTEESPEELLQDGSGELLEESSEALLEDDSEEASEESPVYVLMNIPYSEFYAAEGTSAVDAMTSATKSKTRSTLAAGSYHVNSDGSDITGVIYPVKVNDASVLNGLKQVTDEDSYDITVSLRGQSTTTTYQGKDALFENESYAYYVLSEAPSYYKELTQNTDGSFTFDEATGTTTTKTVDATLITGSETGYGDYQINLEDYMPETVYGVVLHTKEGGSYGLKHVENIWRNFSLAISTGHTTETHGCPLQVYEGAEGQTVNRITYYTADGIEQISLTEDLYLAPVVDEISAQTENAKTIKINGLPEDIKDAKASISYTEGEGRNAKQVSVVEGAVITDGQIALETELEDEKTYNVKVESSNYAVCSTSFTYENVNAVYVLMNIPYSEFYAAEGTSAVDAMTSATKSKTRSTLAAGSYHVNSDGSDITGVIYPVKVNDASMLNDLKQVTDADSYDITVSLRGQSTTTTYQGKDALFENESHAYYILSEKPSYYKKLTQNTDGSFSFDEATGTTTTKTVDATLITGSETGYGDYQINLEDYMPETVYGVVLHTKEGGSYGLKHVENIWRNFSLAISTGHTTETHGCPLQVYEGAEGQTVDRITYYTADGIEQISLTEGLYLAPVVDGISAQLENAKTVKVNGLPEDIKDAKASISYTEGEGRNAKQVSVVEGVTITEGQITLETELEVGKTYSVKVESSNYAVCSTSFTYEEVNTDALKEAIAAAEKLDKANYTTSTWEAMQLELTEAKEAVETAQTQAVIDEALTHLKSAVDALVSKATPKVTLKAKTVTYNGKAQTISAASVTGSNGKVTYNYYSDSKCTKKVSASNVKDVGVYYVKASVAATDTAKAATSSAVKLTIKKANAAIKTKVTSKTYKTATVKKKAQSFSIGASATSKGKVSYKVTKKNSKVSVSSTGKVTVKKGTKKGTYKVTVKISAAFTKNYNAVSKTVTIKVVVK